MLVQSLGITYETDAEEKLAHHTERWCDICGVVRGTLIQLCISFQSRGGGPLLTPTTYEVCDSLECSIAALRRKADLLDGVIK